MALYFLRIHHRSFPLYYQFTPAFVKNLGSNYRLVLLPVDFLHGKNRFVFGIYQHRANKFHGLLQVNGALPGKLRTKHPGEDAAPEKTVDNGLLEYGASRIASIKVERVVVAGNLGELNHIGLRKSKRKPEYLIFFDHIAVVKLPGWKVGSLESCKYLIMSYLFLIVRKLFAKVITDSRSETNAVPRRDAFRIFNLTTFQPGNFPTEVNGEAKLTENVGRTHWKKRKYVLIVAD